MIIFLRTVSIAPGKVAGAVAFGHQIAKLVRDKTGVELQPAMPVGGNPNRLRWRAIYQSLAEFEATTVKLTSDAEYLDFIAKNAELFIAGSVDDEIWRVL
jgi:hypothetical protein